MAFDTSDYRQNTYGTPDYYCDCTRSLASNGDGSLGDPWNLSQAMANAEAGDVVGFLPVADGAQASPVDMAGPSASGYSEVPAFNPANSGSGTAIASRIIFVTKYAAVALDRSTIASNGNRTELRHAGTAAVADGENETGTGGACYGAHTRNYITYDGFFVDMAEAEIRGDTGVLAAQACTGIHFKNFVIKGTTTNCQSNAVIYRPENAVDTVLSNFKAYDFSNDPANSTHPQSGLFSDQYGDQNFLIEHFEIDNIDVGIFLKGTSGGAFNYGTIRYGIVKDTASPFRFNDLDGTNRTYIQYCLAYNPIGARPKVISPDGITFDSISTAGRNITIDHCTIAKVDSADENMNGALVAEDDGLGSGVIITNNIFDVDNDTNGHMVLLLSQLPDTMDYNFYYRNGATETYVYNSVEYNNASTAFADWQTATSRDSNSIEGSSSPFNDRANDDYTIDTEHAAYTASSTGGQLGCYAASETIGVDVEAAGSSDAAASVGACFLL